MHSAGFIIVDGQSVHDNGDFSFRIDSLGLVHAYLGWGRVGQRPEVDVNPIDGPVLTVWIEELTPEAISMMRTLIAEHKDRYKECGVRPANTCGAEMARWVDMGCPEVVVEEVEEEEEGATGNAISSTWATTSEPEIAA